jgi:hypothetical protein
MGSMYNLYVPRAILYQVELQAPASRKAQSLHVRHHDPKASFLTLGPHREYGPGGLSQSSLPSCRVGWWQCSRQFQKLSNSGYAEKRESCRSSRFFN